jgi:hypothetical protein
LRARIALLGEGHQLGGGGFEITALISPQSIRHIGVSAAL